MTSLASSVSFSAGICIVAVLLFLLPISHGLSIIPNIEDVCNSPSLDTVAGIPAEQTCIKHNNITRCWYAYVPDSAKTLSASSNDSSGIPLVFDLHGYDLCAVYNANFTGWKSVAEEYGFVIVWPQGNMNANLSNNPCWDYGDCCCFLGEPPANTNSTPLDFPPSGPDMDDEGFLRQVASNVVMSLASSSSNDTGGGGGVMIDTKRIYFGGHSNGCMMSQAMAALSSDLVAAVCCHASSLPVSVADDYIPTSVQVVYGDLDYSIESIFGSSNHILDTWGAINDCQSNRTIVDESNLYATHTHFNCSNGTMVQTVELFDTGHFPFLGFNPNISLSTGSYPGAKTPTVDTALLSWEFCSQFKSLAAPILPFPVETVPPDVFASNIQGGEGSGGGEADKNDTSVVVGDDETDGGGGTNDTASSISSSSRVPLLPPYSVLMSNVGCIIIIMATVILA